MTGESTKYLLHFNVTSIFSKKFVILEPLYKSAKVEAVAIADCQYVPNVPSKMCYSLRSWPSVSNTIRYSVVIVFVSIRMFPCAPASVSAWLLMD